MFFTIFLLLIGVYCAVGECSNGCSQPIRLYETLKCKPVYALSGDCCPTKFDCSHIRNRNSRYCYFKGRAYERGENIKDEDIYGNCLIDCTCMEKRSGGKGFGCTVLDCAEWAGLTAKTGCYFKYEPNKCCSTGEACSPFNVMCKVNGTVYHEGKRFSVPNNKCLECICKTGFKGKYEAPFCQRIECLDEITNAVKVNNFCAPSYLSMEDCCPRQWICPGSDNIKSTFYSAKDDGPKCQFGDSLLNIGDRFERISSHTGGKVSCECRIPPYLTCLQDERYPTHAGDYQ